MLSQLLERGPVPRTDSYSTNPGTDTHVPNVLDQGRPPADDPEATRVLEAAPRDAYGELRESDPAAARLLDESLAQMPRVGDLFEGFQIVHELGEGAFGRVFLAKQLNLAGRLVALKISADLNGESQRLAQLQHTNIMPIYSEHRTGALHAVCMPFFGSTTLSDLCKALRGARSLPTSGKHLVSTLFNRQSTLRGDDKSVPSSSSSVEPKSDPKLSKPLPIALFPASPTTLSSIEKMSYVDAVLWIGGRLAEGLAHAHERGIIHRDLKPANVLLADDGQPLLLDFNLAEDVKLRQSAAIAQVGGTLPYMSPEQLLAFRDGIGSIDGRGDIYALGLILFHLLTGEHAYPVRRGPSRTIVPMMIRDREGPPPSLREKNRSISPAVESIVQRCLEADPDKRYQTVLHLATDIERHRSNLPLKYAPNTSLIERLAKWSRRHPRLASPTTFACLVSALMLVAVSASVHFSLQRKEREMVERRTDALNRLHQFDDEYHLAIDLLSTDDPVQIAEGVRAGEQALRGYGVLEQTDWLEQPRVKELPPGDRERLKSSIGEIAFLLARAAYFQPADQAQEALNWNRLASEYLGEGPSEVLALQRDSLTGNATDAADHLRMREKLEGAVGLKNKSRFLAACQHAAMGQHRAALAIVNAAVQEDPRDFGSWMIKARCHHALDEFADASASYGTAIALRPTHVRAHLWRAALHYVKRKNLDQAKADLDVALKMQPNLLEGYIDRGLVLFAMGKGKEALEDLDWALGCPGVPSRVWFIRARVKQSLGDKEGAAKDQAQGLATTPTDSLCYVCRGVVFVESDPKAALADFVKAEQLAPRSFDAVYNQAYVHGTKLGKYDEALKIVDRLLKIHPDDHLALTARAIYLARVGRNEEAIAEARGCVKRSPHPETWYRAACVISLASKGDAALREESLKYLATAITRGWGMDKLESDKDLNPLRELPEFQQFLGFARFVKKYAKP